MSERICLRYRRLPEGEFLQGRHLACHGVRLEFDPESSDPGLVAGDLVELECGSTLYLGQIEERHGAGCVVAVEHSLDLAKLPAVQSAWNDTGIGQR
jgi:hypothetical protein